jgi:hypothetical protein
MQTCSRRITEGFAPQPTSDVAFLACDHEPDARDRVQLRLIREIRAVAFVTKLIDEGRLADGKRMLIHVIEAEDVIRELPPFRRLNNDWDFLCHLHEVGRARAGKWLGANFDHLGKDPTVDLEAKYF